MSILSLESPEARRVAAKRRVEDAIRRLHEASKRDEPLHQLLLELDEARSALDALDSPRSAVERSCTYTLLSASIVDALRPVGRRLTTGFYSLDVATRGGLLLGRLVIVAGAPGSGKSTCAAQLADHLERAGCAVVYIAADEPAEGIITRLGQLDGWSRDSLESEGDIGDSVRAGFARRSEGRVLVVIDPDAEDGPRTIEDAEKVGRHLAGDGPLVLIVDSLQTVRCAAAEGAESLRERIDAKIGVLKAIATRGALVLVISEMSRAGYRSGDRATDISALAAAKESGSVEYAAALLLGLRSVKGEAGMVDVEVAKNRLGGAKPEFRLKLDPDRASFAEVARPDGGDELGAKRERFSKLRAAILDAVRSQRLTSASAVYKVVRGTKSEVLAEVKDLLAEGEIVTIGGVLRVSSSLEAAQ